MEATALRDRTMRAAEAAYGEANTNHTDRNRAAARRGGARLPPDPLGFIEQVEG